MLEPITIRYPFRPPQRSLMANQVADLFGLDDSPMSHTIAEELSLDLHPGDVVLFTGPSGSGKSSLLREVGRQWQAVDAATLKLPAVPLIDALPGTLEHRLAMLAACGLSEARLLLRTPAELSEGQRYRFRMAYALATSQAPLMLDEFTAALERTLAKIVAFNLRKQATRTGQGVLAATTHDDIVEDLNPDVWIRCDEGITVERRDVKKKQSVSSRNSGCRTVPEPTGRTSLGGIIGAITSRLPGG